MNLSSSSKHMQATAYDDRGPFTALWRDALLGPPLTVGRKDAIQTILRAPFMGLLACCGLSHPARSPVNRAIDVSFLTVNPSSTTGLSIRRAVNGPATTNVTPPYSSFFALISFDVASAIARPSLPTAQ